MQKVIVGILMIGIIGGAFIAGQWVQEFEQAPRLDIASLLSAGPTPTPVIITGDAVVQKIQAVSRLETTIYSIERVIEASQSDSVWPDWLRGDRLLLIAHGTVVAGVDLGKMTLENVEVAADGQTVTVTLPPAEIFSASLDSEKTRVYDRQQGVFAPTNSDLETEARRAAELEILTAACEDGILGRATVDATRAMEHFLGLMDFRVIVNSSPIPVCGPPVSDS